ncbi:MAG TPA: arsenate reductase ArsC [Armatimonadota bacterium]
MTTNRKLKVLFLCTGNSCRSQMAEGWARALKNDVLEPYSAGIEAHGMNPRAVQVMAEADVDITAQHSKTTDEVADTPFDYVLTVCDQAAEVCPLFPGPGRVIHHSFPDPAQATGSEEEILAVFRQVRDEIRDWVAGMPENLTAVSP